MSKTFDKALHNFMYDVASGDATRHLLELGYTVDEIYEKLEFPTPKSKIADTVLRYYIDNGMVLLERPVASVEKVTYVKEYGAYGRSSLRKKVEVVEIDCDDYIECDFGKQLYKNHRIDNSAGYPDRLIKHLEMLPWPLKNVWVSKKILSQQ